MFGLVGITGWFWLRDRVHEDVFEQKLRETKMLNDAFAEHTHQVINKVDIAILAVREHFRRTESVEDTQRLISQLLLSVVI